MVEHVSSHHRVGSSNPRHLFCVFDFVSSKPSFFAVLKYSIGGPRDNLLSNKIIAIYISGSAVGLSFCRISSLSSSLRPTIQTRDQLQSFTYNG